MNPTTVTTAVPPTTLDNSTDAPFQSVSVPASPDWYCLVGNIDPTWRRTIMRLFEHYTERTPSSFIEAKDIDITWHYRNADPEFGNWQASELQINLEKVLSHMPLTVSRGDKTVEVRPAAVNTATAIRYILNDLSGKGDEIDFILAIGDGKSDETVFSFLNHEQPYNSLDRVLTSTVGKKQTEAKYYLPDVSSAIRVLVNLIDSAENVHKI
ncbi:Trehalose-6-P synthase/phosphatase complex synthase subunit [Spiromyces aspiralis]|uniref:Trehalose-6-P synthase/phosphatase complex synthase subunit n=1 Tax=Spiromyces aspiralis TaxID=68401 RepID=A0ACC1HMI3_9FUNG|nr:Trehalose-6-P synthase/phosphatase complex synthase subunit [Spiromyces aspiralis]